MSGDIESGFNTDINNIDKILEKIKVIKDKNICDRDLLQAKLHSISLQLQQIKQTLKTKRKFFKQLLKDKIQLQRTIQTLDKQLCRKDQTILQLQQNSRYPSASSTNPVYGQVQRLNRSMKQMMEKYKNMEKDLASKAQKQIEVVRELTKKMREIKTQKNQKQRENKTLKAKLWFNQMCKYLKKQRVKQDQLKKQQQMNRQDEKKKQTNQQNLLGQQNSNSNLSQNQDQNRNVDLNQKAQNNDKFQYLDLMKMVFAFQSFGDNQKIPQQPSDLFIRNSFLLWLFEKVLQNQAHCQNLQQEKAQTKQSNPLSTNLQQKNPPMDALNIFSLLSRSQSPIPQPQPALTESNLLQLLQPQPQPQPQAQHSQILQMFQSLKQIKQLSVKVSSVPDQEYQNNLKEIFGLLLNQNMPIQKNKAGWIRNFFSRFSFPLW